MPRPRSLFPPIRRNSRGDAVVTLTDPDGRRREITLGTYGSAAAQAKYDSAVSDWVARGRTLPPDPGKPDPVQPAEWTNNELWLAYLEQVCPRYLRRTEVNHYMRLARLVRVYFGAESASAMSPKRLLQIRASLVKKGLSRRHVNSLMVKFRSVYRFGVEREMVAPAVIDALRCVRPLQPGDAPDYDEIPPVPEGALERTLPFLEPPIRAILQLMDLSAARHGELRILRPGDVDRRGEVWKFSPASHKTKRKGRKRVIYFGKRAQAILEPFLRGIGPDEYCFSPMRYDLERRASMSRRSPETPSQKARRAKRAKGAKKRKRPPGQTYSDAAVARIVRRAIEKANGHAEQNGLPPVPSFTPHQVRHSAATRIRESFDVEAASVILGHSSSVLTDQVYAARNEKLAVKVISEMG